jgi:hypothetical protein
VPRSLHRTLVEAAEREGVNLNAFVTTLLAQGVGQERAVRDIETAAKTCDRPAVSQDSDDAKGRGARSA